MARLSRADAADLDDRVRASEARLWQRYGLTSHSERMIALGGRRVRIVEIEGDSSRPPVLLLHGIASVTAAAVPLVPYFGARRVIAVDWPGHGLSDPVTLTAKNDLRAFAVTVLDAVINTLNLGQIDIVAHSLGGQFALYYALARPERIRRLVLLGAPGAGFGEVAPVLAFKVMSVPGVGKAILGMRASFDTYRKNSTATLGPGAVDDYPRELVEAGWLSSQRPGFARSVASYFRRLITPFTVRAGVPVSHDELATIAVPVLMVWGDKDVFLTPDNGHASIDAIPGARLVVVEGGHAPWLNQLEKTSAEVAGFLDS
ncbi:MAG: hypothetical protein JWQ64_2291 [Subtercola sp.]|nr:hypothetical protein [Subtercola sp.]